MLVNLLICLEQPLKRPFIFIKFVVRHAKGINTMEEESNYPEKQKEDDFSVKRFEEMVENNKDYFFDVHELEAIADHYISEFQWSKALKVLDYGLSIHQLSFNLLIRKAHLLSDIKEPIEGLKTIKQMEAICPNNNELFIIKGNIHSQLGKHAESIIFYKKALDLAEEKDNILMCIAFEYQNLNQNRQALIYFKKAIEENPDHEVALYELAFCYEAEDLLEESTNYYRKYLDQYPYSHAAWYNLGISYSKLGQHLNAIDAYDFAIAIDENFASGYFNKAHALANLGNYYEAISLYRETFKYEDPEAYTYHYIGECFEKAESLKKP